jgi:hypothetical protein
MHLDDEALPRLAYIEPFEHESISHYLGRLRRCKANSLPSAYALGQAAGIGGVAARWEKLYFNPFPTDEELGAIAHLINLQPEQFRTMLPQQGFIMQPRPIRLCAACYDEEPCHRMEWQKKDIIGVCEHHRLRLLERCPRCKQAFKIPALWTNGKCHRCKLPFSSMVKYQERIKAIG